MSQKKRDSGDSERSKKSFAEQLKQIKVRTASKTSASSLEKEKPKNVRSPKPEAPPSSTVPDAELSEDELFEKALDTISPDTIYRGKYEGQGFAQKNTQRLPVPPVDAQEDERREAVLKRREEALFENAVGPVEPIAKANRYYTPGSSEAFENAATTPDSSRPGRTLRTPPLPRFGEGLHEVPPLVHSQRALLKRFKKSPAAQSRNVPELNVRGDSEESALEQLEQFIVDRAMHGNDEFVRVIHGRGLRSEGDPVLKPAILRWLEGPGEQYIRGYIPEVQPGGDYGSLIVELATQNGH